MFLLVSNYDNENLTKSQSETKKPCIQPKNIFKLKKKHNLLLIKQNLIRLKQ